MPHIFISYATPDRATAAEIAAFLKDNGYEVWWDRELLGGQDYQQEIEEALEKSEAAIVLWSSESINSRWVRGEAEAAASGGKLLPVRKDDLDPSRLPIGFKTIHTVPVSDHAGMLASLEKLRVVRAAQPRSPWGILLARQSRRLRALSGAVTWKRLLAVAAALALSLYAYLDYLDWTRIADSPAESDYERHIATYPIGFFRGRADARLAGRTQWATIRSVRDPTVLDEFLKRYPESLYAPFARVRASRLRAEASGSYKSVIAETSTRAINPTELAPLNCERLWMARNEIFYRNGRCFTSEDGINAFDTKKDCPYSSCPAIRAINTIIDQHIMTQLEFRDVGLIREAEDRLGCRLPNAVGLCAPAQPRR